jgi:hypothetical protein
MTAITPNQRASQTHWSHHGRLCFPGCLLTLSLIPHLLESYHSPLRHGIYAPSLFFCLYQRSIAKEPSGIRSSKLTSTSELTQHVMRKPKQSLRGPRFYLFRLCSSDWVLSYGQHQLSISESTAWTGVLQVLVVLLQLMPMGQRQAVPAHLQLQSCEQNKWLLFQATNLRVVCYATIDNWDTYSFLTLQCLAVGLGYTTDLKPMCIRIEQKT